MDCEAGCAHDRGMLSVLLNQECVDCRRFCRRSRRTGQTCDPNRIQARQMKVGKKINRRLHLQTEEQVEASFAVPQEASCAE